MTKSNAQRCRERRERLRLDPERFEHEKRLDRERRQRNYVKPRTPEELEHVRRLKREAQKRYLAKKKEEAAARVSQGIPSPRKTRLDVGTVQKKKEANRLYVQKHRAQQSAQKKRRVREKNRAYYHSKKAKKIDAAQRKEKRAAEEQDRLNDSGCPCPTQSAYKKTLADKAADKS